MRYRFTTLFLVGLISNLWTLEAFSVDLVGMVNVSKTSDTAAKAKTEAMDVARRQILFEVLSNYSDIDSLAELMNNTSDDDLVRLVSTTSVSNEQISSETYSATIAMNIDNDMAKRWLTSNDVKNWVPIAETTEMFSLFIVLPNGISDWAELKRIVGNDKKELNTITIVGNQIFAKLPLSYKANFTAAIREAGWRFADNSGVLQVWR
ncbi:MAG: hypothetical protein J6S57_00600 [Alphaproteobacteria bacterium]|nr:hypothetical protein [Alphaproteobacteria bacterium]